MRHELVVNCRAQSRLVILDCCYCGTALEGYMGAAEEEVVNRARVDGTYIMTSTAKTAPGPLPGWRHWARRTPRSRASW
ncbi:hypothetical protein [Streptomyces kanamyceticus]|uniref:Uncharacterized protein n=1 Tax=Streptomyces kanamyceticus TaxID=1967 RepID=A0A5J6G572_STRKN|nr:hypothetical protein [Streptomyces kanamyceticus]QEU90800.1 hypothetical protein CP970_07715 [Streptomyces kanamyceticus]